VGFRLGVRRAMPQTLTCLDEALVWTIIPAFAAHTGC
jgi:hypothetical protein